MRAAPRLFGYRLGGPMATPPDTTPGPLLNPTNGPPKKRSRRFRIFRALGIGFAGLIVISAIGGALGNHSPKPAPAAASSPAVTHATAPATHTATVAKAKPALTVTVTAKAAPAVTVTAAPAAPAAPAADTKIATFTGTGSGNTGSFTVPADGNWHLSYEYTNGSLFAGQAENFQVYEYGTDGTMDQVLANALGIGNGQPTAVPVYSDTEAGSTVYFQIVTDDASWQLVALTGTS